MNQRHNSYNNDNVPLRETDESFTYFIPSPFNFLKSAILWLNCDKMSYYTVARCYEDNGLLKLSKMCQNGSLLYAVLLVYHAKYFEISGVFHLAQILLITII